MSIGVDRLRYYGWKLRGREVKSCHLLADSEAELHAFARRIGCAESWCHRGRVVHYDLTDKMRKRAISAGAVVLDAHGLSRFLGGTKIEDMAP